MKRYKIIAAALVLGMTLILGGCGSNKEAAEKKNDSETDKVTESTEETKEETGEDTAAEEELLSGKHQVEISVKDFGTMKLELDADIAPITVTNFVKLAKEGFYDGLTFHRIIPGFMIQGGDPLGNGMGGSDENIKGEFAANGVENNLSHKRGVISMARSQENDSASSQFFIMHEDSPHLDGQYAAFGVVTEGIEIVDQICENTPVTMNNGGVTKENQPVIESIKVVE